MHARESQFHSTHFWNRHYETGLAQYNVFAPLLDSFGLGIGPVLYLLLEFLNSFRCLCDPILADVCAFPYWPRELVSEFLLEKPHWAMRSRIEDVGMSRARRELQMADVHTDDWLSETMEQNDWDILLHDDDGELEEDCDPLDWDSPFY